MSGRGGASGRCESDTIDRAVVIAERVRSIVRDFAPRCGFSCTLSGLCSVASYGLVRALRDEKIRAELVGGSYLEFPHLSDSRQGHFWVEIDRTTIIDITRTQFALPPEESLIDVAVLRPAAPASALYASMFYGAQALRVANIHPRRTQRPRWYRPGWWRAPAEVPRPRVNLLEFMAAEGPLG